MSATPGNLLELVECCSGVGELRWEEQTRLRARYRVNRYQGMAASGLPIPGLHRIDGTVDLAGIPDPGSLVGSTFTLELEDGRVWRLTLADADGRVLTVGHGPSRCRCC